jgi:ankyrin repeat protein
MSLELPQKPNLEYLKNQAKDLLRRARTGDAEALTRFHSPNQLQLADALHAVANDYGFATWPKLKEYVESLAQPWGPPELLTAAIRAQDASDVEKLLRDHPELRTHLDEPAANYGEGLTPLLAAVQYSHRPIIGALLQAGAGINARSHFWAGGVGVLDECAPDLAPFLIERGAALDAHSAARLGLLDQLRDFEKSKPVLQNTHGARGQTPLHFASTIEIAQLLLDHGAEIDALDLLHESTPAQHMLRVVQARYFPRDRQDVARFLIARGCRTDIYMAAALGDLAMAQSQVETNPACLRLRTNEADFPKHDPRSQGSIYLELFGHNRTPQMVARDFGHEDVYRYLLDRSPEDVKLSQAFELGDEPLFREFLARRPNLIATLSDAEKRQLPDAAQNNNADAVRLMLKAGWPVDVKGEYNLTALAWAAWHGNAEIVREVLRHQPGLERTDCDFGITALNSALHGSMNSWHRDTGDYAATVEALLEAGSKAPKVTDDLEASDEVKEVLRRHAN